MNDRSERHEPPLAEAIAKDDRLVLLEPQAEHGVAVVRRQVLVGDGELEHAPFADELRGLAQLVAERHPNQPEQHQRREGYDHEAVGLWELQGGDDVARVVQRLRAVSARGEQARVSPNHVLVPCPHWCPATAPEPTDEKIDVPRFDDEHVVDVLVIDAGWVDVPRLAERGGIEVVDAGPTPAAPAAASAGIAAGGTGLLPAIAGHATFIVGEIAARCPSARILVVNHPDPWADEWSVAASLARWGGAHCDVVPDVISCGFAVATLHDRPSFPFAHALGQLDPRTGVIAPAGNQSSFVPHWPAAFKRVVGVGAYDESNGNAIADFSNRGVWVDCAAGGRDVVSTFVRGEWTPQDAATATPEDFGDFARWSGTSFSTPRVTAAVATRLAASRARGAANCGRRAAHKLAAGLVPGLVIGSDLELGTKLKLP